MRNPFSSPGLLGNNLGSSPFVLILNMSKDSSRGGKKWKIWSKPIVTIKGARSFSARRLAAGLAYRCDSLTVNPGEEQKSVHWWLPVVVCVFILNVCAAPTVSLRACGAAFFYPLFCCDQDRFKKDWRLILQGSPPLPGDNNSLLPPCWRHCTGGGCLHWRHRLTDHFIRYKASQH